VFVVDLLMEMVAALNFIAQVVVSFFYQLYTHMKATRGFFCYLYGSLTILKSGRIEARKTIDI